MDPDICLRDCMSLADQIIREADEAAEDEDQHSDEAIELAECVKNLNDWICRGGFLPRDWRNDETLES